MACNSYANCYIGCSCKTGWNKRSASASSVSDVSNLQTSGVKTASASSLSGNVSTMAAGDSCTVNITDPRYGTKCSISSTRDCAGVCDGSAYFRCTSGSTSSSCPSGQYSVYLGKQQCSSGNATNSTSCYTCYTCSYSCPDGYSTSTTSSSCGSGYTFKSTSATTQSGCSSKTCGKCEKDEYCACSYTIWPEKVSRGSYFDIYYWAEIKCTRDIRDHEEIVIELSQIHQSGGIDCGAHQDSATIYLPAGNMKAKALTKFKEGMGCYVNDSNMHVYVTPPKTFRADNITCTWE